jgi:hypothetical protein
VITYYPTSAGLFEFADNIMLERRELDASKLIKLGTPDPIEIPFFETLIIE